MGKPKLRSSIRALQVAIGSLRPIGPACVQLAKTDSFRAGAGAGDLYSIYYASSPSSSSSSSLEFSKTEEDEALLPSGAVSSTRFFFSPSSTKSIMEEARLERGEPEEEEEEEKVVGFCEESSVTTCMDSEDPYRDFRESMEEMVAAHGVRDWARLQELLHCYLRLNDKSTHSIIVLAFVDLLMSLMAEDKDGLCSNSADSSPPPSLSVLL